MKTSLFHKPRLWIVFFLLGLMLVPVVSSGQGLPQDSISVSVQDVKLEKVLHILSEKSGMKFIADPAVKDRLISLDLVNVQPLEALSIMTELYDLGFQQLGDSGKFVVASKSEIRVQTEVGSYRCEFAPAEELAGIVGRVVTPDVGTVFHDSRTNTLIYQDTPSQMTRIERLIRQLDRPTRQGVHQGGHR